MNRNTGLVFGRIITHFSFITFNVVAAEKLRLWLTVCLIAPHRVQTCDPLAPPFLHRHRILIRVASLQCQDVYLLIPNQRNSAD